MLAPRLAIIGAGLSGLAAAWKLRDSSVACSCFEKSRGVSGRATSRTRHDVRLDPGANYIKAEPEEIEHLLVEELPTEDLIRIPGDVWTFDESGSLSPGDPGLNATPKWNYRNGISTLGKLLAAGSGVSIEHQCRIASLVHEEGAWSLIDEEGAARTGFDAVLLTPPAPQAIAILEASAAESSLLAPPLEGLREARYHQQLCFALGAAECPDRPGDFFALLNADRRHRIAWLSFENDKEGRVPGGETVVTVQMQPEWSAEHYEADEVTLLADVVSEVRTLLRWPDFTPNWHDLQRWRFAHPYNAADTEALHSSESSGLFFAGDALVGKGRANLAIETGLRAGERIARYLGAPA